MLSQISVAGCFMLHLQSRSAQAYQNSRSTVQDGQTAAPTGHTALCATAPALATPRAVFSRSVWQETGRSMPRLRVHVSSPGTNSYAQLFCTLTARLAAMHQPILLKAAVMCIVSCYSTSVCLLLLKLQSRSAGVCWAATHHPHPQHWLERQLCQHHPWLILLSQCCCSIHALCCCPARVLPAKG
jgi:hypothetical protein